MCHAWHLFNDILDESHCKSEIRHTNVWQISDVMELLQDIINEPCSISTGFHVSETDISGHQVASDVFH